MKCPSPILGRLNHYYKNDNRLRQIKHTTITTEIAMCSGKVEAYYNIPLKQNKIT